MKIAVTVLAIFSLLIPLVLVAGEPPALTHNPFSRPSSEVTIHTRRVTSPDGIPSSTPVLRATMVSSLSRLANVGGHILRAGDEIQGYRLVEIYEEYAVFDRGDQSITVFVKPYLAGDDD